MLRTYALLGLIVCLLAPAYLNAQTANDPTQINPVGRSWKYTQRGDYVLYKVLGHEEWNQESWRAAGNKGNNYGFQVKRFLDGDEVGTPTLRTFQLDPKSLDRRFATKFEINGYFASRQLRQNGDVVIPTLRLEHAIKGVFEYSEDVPLGGLVRSVDNESGVQYTLVKFGRKQDPPPSRILVEKKGADKRVEGITQRGEKTEEQLAPVTKELVTIVRQDADIIPTYFRPSGNLSSTLDKAGWITTLKIEPEKSAARYNVSAFTGTMENEAAKRENQLYTYTLRFQNEGWVETPDGKGIKVTQLIENPEGDVPQEILDQPKAAIVTPNLPLVEANEFKVYKAKDRSFKIYGSKYNGRGFSIFEKPQIKRTPINGGGEEQDITRIKHYLWLDLTSTGQAVILQHDTYTYNYYQKTDASNKVIEMKDDQLLISQKLEYFRTDVPDETLDVYSVPLQ
jgi:hypothetical protein